MPSTQRIELPKQISDYLVSLPESGMGYQLVKVITKSGEILRNLKVFNSTHLLVEEETAISRENIERVELES